LGTSNQASVATAEGASPTPGAGWLAVLPALVLAVWIYGGITSFSLLGLDTYSQLAGARITSWSDFADTFREPLGDGRLRARFYRPTHNLILAADYARAGLEPSAHQRSSLALFLVAVVALFGAIRRTTGSWLGAMVASLFFTLHGCLLPIVPVPARRADLLVIAGTWLALWVLPTRSDDRVWPRWVIAGLLATLTAGAKEPGVVVLALIVFHQWMFGPVYRGWSAWFRGLVAALPAAIGVGLYAVARTATLGGLGGYPNAGGTLDYGAELIDVLGLLAQGILAPWWPGDVNTLVLGWWVALSGGAAVAISVALAVGRGGAARRAANLVLLGLAWLVPMLLVLGMVKAQQARYAFLLIGPVALIVGGVAAAVCPARQSGGWRRLAAGTLVLALASSSVVALRASPLLYGYDTYARASLQLSRFLDDLGRRVAATPPGQRLDATLPFRLVVPSDAQQPGARVPLLVRHSLDSWAALSFPERRVRVISVRDSRRLAPDPDATIIVLEQPAG